MEDKSTRENKLEYVEMEDDFINMTPHDLVFLVPAGKDNPEMVEIGRIRPHGTYIRLIPMKEAPMRTLENGIDVMHPPCFTDYSPAPKDFLPDESKGLIVSSMMAEYWLANGFEWKGGYYSPDSGPESSVRFPRGHKRSGEIMGIQRLICWKPPCV